jgi:hypothetical protein
MEITLKLKHTLAAGLAALTLFASTGGAFAALGVALEDADVFESADDESDVVDELDKGEFIQIEHCKGREYCLIQSDDGEGYVAVENLALVTNDEDDEDADEDADDEDEDEEDDE